MKTWICLLLCIACPSFGAETTPKTAPQEESVELAFALYFAPKPSADPEKALAKLLAEPDRRLAREGSASEGKFAFVQGVWIPLRHYAPPDAVQLRYFGVGVPPSAADDLAAAERVFVVTLRTFPRHLPAANRAASHLMADLAREVDALIWDEETRQVFSTEAWTARRVKTWTTGDLPEVRAQVAMRALTGEKMIRIVTLGMRKFGLPDLVFSEVTHANSAALGNLLNALMQRLVEGQLPQDGTLVLRIDDLRHPAVRARETKNLGTGAKGIVRLSLQPVKPEQGDANNAQWSVDFPDAKSKDALERAMWGVDQLYGRDTPVSSVGKRDAEMAAARTRARAAFFAMEKSLRAGPAEGERLSVKASFSEGEETEYMWVEVTGWGIKHVEGILTNEPLHIRNVRRGAKVKVQFDEIYDYLLYRANGTEEGNETGKILLRRENPKSP